MSDLLQRDDTKILICFAKDKDDLWSDIFGGGWEYMEWWVNVDYQGGDWEKHGKAVITYMNPDDPSTTLSKELTVVDLANAWSALTESGWHHCGNNTLDDPDACTSDAVLQQAVFGELIYG